MALNQIPGFGSGYTYASVSSNDKRAIGKFTDSNHLSSFHSMYPQDYDKKIISLYTQSSLYANDFLNMVNASEPYYLDGRTDTWQWEVEKPYEFPQIVEVPDAVLSATRPGIDGQEFDLIIDTAEFKKNAIVMLGHKMYGQNLYAVTDPRPAGARTFIQTFTLVSTSPQTQYVNKQFLQPGINLELSHHNIGEFDQDLGGLRKLADKLIMYETIGSGDGLEHGITAWADDRVLKDQNGNPLDILMYWDKKRNAVPRTMNEIKWEPFVESLLRKQMVEQRVSKMIWAKPGVVRTNGSRQEVKKESAGVYWRMKNSGHYVPYNRGEFSGNLLRTVFGDLFYRRVSVQNRHVKLYTNEAGFNTFQQAIKEDAMGSGLVFNVGDNDKFISGSGQNLVLNFSFSSMVTRETGRIDLVHLTELDLPQSNLEFGQNKMSTPIFMVFDVSSQGGIPSSNIREVRYKNRPNLEWSYIDGRRSHLGAFASQGHSAASKFPGYQITMDARYDVFIEDMSKMVLIEEIPQF